MIKILGTMPEFGIPSQEDGLLLDSMSCQHQAEWYEQKNNKGRKCGMGLVDEYVTVSLGGAVALGSTAAHKCGASLTLANTVPDCWCETPETTTSIIKEVSTSYSNSDAVKRDLSVDVLAFAESQE